jgi:hypothetical protein
MGDLTHKDPKLVNAFAERVEDGTYKVLKRQGVGNYQTLSAPPAGWALTKPVGEYYAESLGTIFSSTTPVVLTFVEAFNSGANDTTVIVYFNGANPVAAMYHGGVGPVGTGPAPSSGITCIQYSGKLVAANLSNGAGQSIGIGVFVIDVNAKSIVNNAAVSVGPASSTTSALGITALDSTIYTMDANAVVYGSALNDATTWPALSLIQANSEPGAGVYITKHHAYVVAMKEFSIEFLYDVPNPTGSPLSPVLNSAILWGCVAAGSVQLLGNRIFWLARERQGAPFVAMLDAMVPIKISTPGVDKLVGDPVGPFQSFTFRDSSGHQYYGLTDVGSVYTIVYDIDQKLWAQWNSPGFSYFPYKSIIVHSNGSVLAQSTEAANANKIYQIDEEFLVDVGGSFDWDLYTPNSDLGTRKRKTLMRIDFITDQQPGKLYSRWSEDDFRTFSQFREVDLNVKRPTLTNCGTFRRRAYHFHHNAPYALRMEAVELDVLLGV